MKTKIFAAITAFMLSLTPLTAHAAVILVEPEEPINLEDYTTSYTALKEADHIMFSGNQVLISFQLPVMVDGCVITPNTMEWEVSGTADVTYESGSFLNSVSYEENYANTYCLITANSPGSVHVIGTEYSLYDSDGTEFYFNFNVAADGNFDETVDMDNPIEPVIAEDSVCFPKPDTSCEFSLLVSSNLESSAVHDNAGCTFTPEEDGRYVISTRELCEEIVECDIAGHFHYFYPVMTNYTVDVEDGEITVTYQGSKSWYSEEQVDLERMSLMACDVVGMCYDVYAADPDDVLNYNYFSFVNGQLPNGTNGYDSYITNIYGEYSTESYFCVNYFYSDVATAIPVDRVIALEQDISSLETITWASSWCAGDLELATDDYWEFSRIAAPEDGDLTIVVDEECYYPLTVENGIFHHRKATSGLMGDCNNDGKFSLLDIIMLQKYLLSTGNLTIPQNADMCADGEINAFDLALMKRELIQNAAEPLLLVREDRTVINENGWDSETYIEVLDANGFWHVRESDTDAWDLTAEDCLAQAPAIIAGTEPSGQFEAAQLAEVRALVQDAAQYQDAELMAWDFGVDDYGQEDLYAVCPDGNGGYQAVELCRFGGECAWLEDADVQEFVAMLIQNGYYADESIFNAYLEYYAE